MSKEERYTPPAFPEDVLPDIDYRIQEIKARLDKVTESAYENYHRARAVQAAAETALSRGEKKQYNELMDGWTEQTPQGAQKVPGVKDLDRSALMKWAQARVYMTELKNLEAQKAAQPAKEEPTEEETANAGS